MTIVVALKDHSGIDTASLAIALEQQAASVQLYWPLGDAVRVVRYKTRKPTGAWRISFYDELPPGEGGVHMNTRSGHPYAKVLASEGTLAASHEFCEMLVDPLGRRFQTVGERDYLVEVCDPVERVSYELGGVAVSDFILPAWYTSPVTQIGDASFTGECSPREILAGGYVSWIEHTNWWQAFVDAAGRVTSRILGRAELRTRAEKDWLAAA